MCNCVILIFVNTRLEYMLFVCCGWCSGWVEDPLVFLFAGKMVNDDADAAAITWSAASEGLDFGRDDCCHLLLLYKLSKKEN